MMTILKSIVICTLLTISCLNALGNETWQENNKSSRKFDEFGNINAEDWKSRLENLSIHLRKEPRAKGYIVLYRSYSDLPGLNLRYGLRTKNYLLQLRGHTSDEIVVIDGGEDSCLRTELWIVPNGAEPPNPAGQNRYKYERVNRDFLRKFDEYVYYLPSDSDCGFCGYEDEAARLNSFASLLKKEPQLRGYIIAYPKYYEDRGMENADGRTLDRSEYYVEHDAISVSPKMLENEKRYLVKTHGINPARLITVNGGYRIDRMVELWVGPSNAPAPNPTPNIYPKRKKGR